MRRIELESLPEILFAHVHQAQQYHKCFETDQSVLEISYIAQGKIYYKTGDSVLRAQTGDVICFARDCPVEVEAEAFHCHHTVCAKVKWKMAQEGRGIMLPRVIQRTEESEKLCAMIDSFVYAPRLHGVCREYEAARFLDLLCKIDEITKKQKEKHSETDLLVKRAVEYMHARLYERLTQREIAQHLGISPGYLCAIFKKAYGMPLMKYLNMEKLKTVAQLMERGNLKLYEACRTLGYEDPNYVSSLYKKLFGRNITDLPKRSDSFQNRM